MKIILLLSLAALLGAGCAPASKTTLPKEASTNEYPKIISISWYVCERLPSGQLIKSMVVDGVVRPWFKCKVIDYAENADSYSNASILVETTSTNEEIVAKIRERVAASKKEQRDYEASEKAKNKTIQEINDLLRQ